MKKSNNSKPTNKLIPATIVILVSLGVVYLSLQMHRAYSEYRHWKSRESVLVKELEDLREEARHHQVFLDRLRRNPDFQDEVARKELGYGQPDEWLYRFPYQKEINP